MATGSGPVRGLLAHAGSLAPFLVWGIGCAGLRGLWERLPGRWVAFAQSDSSRHYDPALGKHQWHSSRRAAEAERALLRAVAVPGSGADRSGRSAADPPAARAGRASIGYTRGAWIVRSDGTGTLGGVQSGAPVGN